jgi:hypothetical protein
MSNNNKLMRRNDLVWREIDGEVVILSPDNKYMHTFNEIGSRIWALMDGERDINTIADIIAEEYGEKNDIVKKDLAEYIKQLKQLKLMEE